MAGPFLTRSLPPGNPSIASGGGPLSDAPGTAVYYISFIRELLSPTITADMRSLTCSFLNSRRM
ncbi:hypothetical protein SPHFLASMR4Y_00178 [Sphingorhabdus sp. SMR4y]|nr:hypothetical protein SPHFLASMR4Y_00178 [Sphingorhabdus sp. SMR4y]